MSTLFEPISGGRCGGCLHIRKFELFIGWRKKRPLPCYGHYNPGSWEGQSRDRLSFKFFFFFGGCTKVLPRTWTCAIILGSPSLLPLYQAMTPCLLHVKILSWNLINYFSYRLGLSFHLRKIYRKCLPSWNALVLLDILVWR